jgi:hypothetical protein
MIRFRSSSALILVGCGLLHGVSLRLQNEFFEKAKHPLDTKQ